MKVSMRLHYLQHVPFEDLANVEPWARQCRFSITGTRFYAGELPPAPEAFDWLVVLGGPMNIYEEAQYPWLAQEKACICRAIEEEKTLLGICLGAQLIADVLGGPVTANPSKEIGWFPVFLTEEGLKSHLFRNVPPSFPAFHWHGDTFAIPRGAQRLAWSQACANQAFVYADRVVGLQFHLEYSTHSIESMLQHCAPDIAEEPFIQPPDVIRAQSDNLPQTETLMNTVLNALLTGTQG